MGIITNDLLKADRNNLTLVRLFLASAVIWSHSFEILGYGDPTSILFNRPISRISVDAFFILSGFLMARSLEHNKSIFDFALSRFMRIAPGLFVMSLVVVAAFIPFTSVSLGEYLLGKETLKFVFFNQLNMPAYGLTGVIANHNPLTPVNGSLWSIVWEVRCYVAIAIVSMLGMLNRRIFSRVVLPLTVGAAFLYSIPMVAAKVFAITHGHVYFIELPVRLWTEFVLGAGAYLFRDKLAYTGKGALLLFPVVFFTQHLFCWQLIQSVAALYWTFYLGFTTAARFGAVHKVPDISYGIYIYSYPTAIFILNFVKLSPLELAFFTVLFSFPIAWVSWTKVEKPAIDARKNFRLPTIFRKPAL